MNQDNTAYHAFRDRWTITQSIVMIVSMVVGLKYGVKAILPGAMIMFMILMVHVPRYTSLPGYIGLPNMITLFRLAGILILFWISANTIGWTLFWGFLLMILLDGLDGWIARRFDQSSEIGGQFDMEVDAFLVLGLSLVHFETGNLGGWILIPGGMRYYFEIIIRVLKLEIADYPPKKMRATIAVVFFLSLLSPFVLPRTSIIICLVSSGFVLLSFGSSLIKSLRTL